MLCYSGWRTHKGICSWTGPLSGDGILFLKLSVPLKRRRWKDRSEPGWVCKCHTCGAGSLAPRPASPRDGSWLTPEHPFCRGACSKGVCIHGERFPAPWRWPFHWTGFLQEAPAISCCEWTPLLQLTTTGFSFPPLLFLPGQAWLIRNTCKQNTLQHSSIWYYTEWWVSCRWPSDVLQPVLSKRQKAARQCCWNVAQRITWSLHISGKQEQGGERGLSEQVFSD